jgi:hypothetical protein
MTLKEKFKQWLDTQPREQIREVQLEIIAEEFAIGFAEWMAKEYWLNSSGKYMQGQTHKELLEIYKKEKGL